MFDIYVIYNCFEGKGKEFVSRVTAAGIADVIRAEEGCIRYDYYLNYNSPDKVLLIEGWESPEHQKVHMTQPHMADLMKIKNECVVDVKIGKFELSEL